MGFFQRLFAPGSAQTQLLQDLAALAGRNEGLVERLRRHAALTAPNIRGQVESLAEAEAGHVKVLNSILADHDVWAKMPESALHDGANNWARLSGDLLVLGALAADLRINAMRWEAVDEGIAATLLELAIEDEDRESQLRKLAMLCDAMAID